MKETELITNSDGSIFHLMLRPGEVADKVIIVGDPGRVDLVGKNLDSISLTRVNREFRTITGTYRGKEISVISSGIGTDNIDILINELDALFNFDLQTRLPVNKRKSIDIVRLGTCGGLQPDLEPGEPIITGAAIGFDGVMNFYEGTEEITDPEFEYEFMSFTGWSDRLPRPYIIRASEELLSRFSPTGYIRGLTVSTPGFYAPQGRKLYLSTWKSDINERIMDFRYKGERILNYEMESSAIYGLSTLLGHRALTICSAIGNRANGSFIKDYKPIMNDLSIKILDLI